MLGRSPILLHHIAWEIDDYQTWYNFALVSKKCSQAARYFAKQKKREFSQQRVVDEVQLLVLPNGWVHGPVTHSRQTGYYIDGRPSQTAIWDNKYNGHNPLLRKIVTKHLIISDRKKNFALARINTRNYSGEYIESWKCPNCGWLHIVYTFPRRADGSVNNIFMMVQRCGDQNYQRLVIRDIYDDEIQSMKWYRLYKYSRKHPTGFRFQDLPADFKK